MNLSTAELEIMQQIWQAGQTVTAALLADMLQEKGWKPTTLLTFLTRLVAKGALICQKQGKQNHYTASITQQQYNAQRAKEMLDSFYSGSVKSMVVALYQDKSLTNDEIAELKSWLEER